MLLLCCCLGRIDRWKWALDMRSRMQRTISEFWLEELRSASSFNQRFASGGSRSKTETVSRLELMFRTLIHRY
jgi:hypothetical protein